MVRAVVTAWICICVSICAVACGQREPTKRPPEATLRAIVDHYAPIQEALAADSMDGVADHAARLADVAALAAQQSSGDLASRLRAVHAAARPLSDAKEIAPARAAFAELSRAVVELVAAEPSLAEGRRVFECPMADAFSYKKWIQTGPGISNPYFGSEMPTCGSPSEFR